MLKDVLIAVNLYNVCRGAGSFKEFQDIQRLPKQNTPHEGQIFSNKGTAGTKQCESRFFAIISIF